MNNKSLTAQAHEYISKVLKPGDLCIDATTGNGHDTLFLAQTVGEQGHVYAFDVQQQAIAMARQRMQNHGIAHVTFYPSSHENLSTQIPAAARNHIKVIMFNLGYLPGGDKSITTLAASTLDALDEARNVLAPGGLLSVMAYPGHQAGRQETESVMGWMNNLPENGYRYDVIFADKDKPDAPVLFFITSIR